jgi:hypothetical protein
MFGQNIPDPKANIPDPKSFFKVKNISKSNVLLGPFFKNVYAIQERVLTDRITVVTSVRTRIPTSFKGGKFGKINTRDNGSYNPFASAKLSGIGNITEFRLYGKKRGALHGVYGELFFSYMHYKLASSSFPATFHDDAGIEYKADVTQTIKINNTGGGLGFGVQGLFIKDRLCIDWTICRVGLSALGIKGGIEATNTTDNFDFRNYTEDVNKTTFGVEKLLPVKKTVEKRNIDIGVKVPWVIFQMGLNIGFAY